MKTRITKLLDIKYPIIQAGMVWVSGWKLASAVSNCGGLGLIGAGSMKSDLLREHIQKCKAATNKPFGVNIPLLRKDADDLVKVCLDEGVKIFFTSAGNPKTFTSHLKESGCTVIHVVANLKYGLNAQEAGCDAVQIFDTWGGILSQKDFEEFSLRYVEKIISQIKRKDEPVIFFAKGVHFKLNKLASIGADVLGLDWTMDLGKVRKEVGDKVALQGNLDPTALYADKNHIKGI